MKCVHPKGLRKRISEAPTIEEAMSILLTASSEERKLRTRIREAATLEIALEALMDTGEADEDEREQTDGEGNDEDQGVAADASSSPRLDVKDTLSPKDAKRNNEVLAEKDYDKQPLKSARRDKGLFHDVIGKSDTTNWLTETFCRIVDRYAELRLTELT